MNKIVRYINKRNFVKNVLILLSGSSISQFILIGISPIITRLYSPQAFGQYELFYSVVSLFTAFAYLQYDLSIYTVESKESAINAWAASTSVMLVSCILFSFSIFCFKHYFLKISGAKIETGWVWMVPTYVFFAGGYNILINWFTKFGDFKLITSLRIILSIITAALQISFGLLDLGYWGLVASTLMVQAITFFIIFISFYKRNKVYFHLINLSKIKSVLVSNKRLPLLVFPGNFLNNISQNLPAFFLAQVDHQVLGYYGFARRIIGLPLTFISSSFQSLFMKDASDEFSKTGSARITYKKNLTIYSCIAAILLLSILILTKPVVPVIFGMKWNGVVPYIKILAVVYLIRFISGGLSFIMVLGKGPKIDIFWQVGGFAVTYLGFYYSMRANFSPLAIVTTYVTCLSIFYILYLYQSFNIAKGRSFFNRSL